jgi:hypothetical protein
MSLTNTNEANGVLVENIPITVEEGNIGDHVDQGYMVNTKKLASIIKGSKEKIALMVLPDKVIIGDEQRKFDLSIFNVDRKAPAPVNLFDYKIQIKDVLKNLSDAQAITENSEHISELFGTLFSEGRLMASDKLSALYIEKTGLLDSAPKDLSDIVFSTDLFCACLTKTSEAEAMIGFTTDNQCVVLKIGNATIYKRLMENKFPKERILKAVTGVQESMNSGAFKATVSLADFLEKLHEIRDIVESDDYFVGFNKDNIITIESTNTKAGAEGKVIINAEVLLPAEIGQSLVGKFAYVHLNLLGTLFSGVEKLELHSSLGRQGTTTVMRYLATKADGKMFFATPRG